MRLTSLYIGQYKNLRDFSLSFDGGSFIDVFVGKNGTGKSNLFEALIEIFRHVVWFDRDKASCVFNYRIGFEIDGKATEIGWNSEKLAIGGKERKTVSETDPLKGMIKKWAEGESYALMLPVPDNADIQKQVIRNAATGETFGGDSCCEIEHLFYGIDATKNYYQQEPCVGGTKIVFKSDGEKTAFAKEVVPTLAPACFEVFRPMFEFIKSKCGVVPDGREAD